MSHYIFGSDLKNAMFLYFFLLSALYDVSEGVVVSVCVALHYEAGCHLIQVTSGFILGFLLQWWLTAYWSISCVLNLVCSGTGYIPDSRSAGMKLPVLYLPVSSPGNSLTILGRMTESSFYHHHIMSLIRVNGTHRDNFVQKKDLFES